MQKLIECYHRDKRILVDITPEIFCKVNITRIGYEIHKCDEFFICPPRIPHFQLKILLILARIITHIDKVYEIPCFKEISLIRSEIFLNVCIINDFTQTIELVHIVPKAHFCE